MKQWFCHWKILLRKQKSPADSAKVVWPCPSTAGIDCLAVICGNSVLVNFKTAYFFCFFTDPFISLLIFLQNTQTLDEFLKDRGGQQTFRPGFGETVDEVDEITIPKG